MIQQNLTKEAVIETLYKITFRKNDGSTEAVELQNQNKAKELIWDRIKDEPYCSADVVIAEYEPETPNKQSVRLERYERKGSEVIRINY